MIVSMHKVSLIFNPAAGRVRRAPEMIDHIRAALRDAGVETTPLATSAPGDATALAREAVERKDQFIVVCGGDGTINEAAQALVGTGTALAVWPGGTANVLAKELDLPNDPKMLAALIADGHARTISVGSALKPGTDWQRYFLLMAGVGIDAAIVRGVNPRLKRKTAYGAFWASALDYLARLPLTPFSLGVDDMRHEGVFACIANASSYGGWFTIAPKARLEEAELDVCLFNSRGRASLLAYALLGLTGSHTRSRGVIYRKAKTAVANSNDAAPVQLDGEFVGMLPMRFEILPHALKLIAPERSSHQKTGQ